MPALDLNLHRPGSEVVAAEQPTQPDQVLYPLPLCQKANVGGLQRELGRRDEHWVSGREYGDEVEGRIGHAVRGLSAAAPLGASRVPAPASAPRSPGAPESRRAHAAAC